MYQPKVKAEPGLGRVLVTALHALRNGEPLTGGSEPALVPELLTAAIT